MLSGAVKSYQVWGRLSEGGMGDVWLARHIELALPVIIKTLKTLGGADGGEPLAARYARLLGEARLTARMTSPRVVKVMDVGVHEETTPYLVEEYVDGLDLAELDRRRRQALRRPLPLWLVADYLAQAAEGLHAAHQSGVIHRDVKPGNLFGYGHGSLKVGDFGVAVASYSETCQPASGTPLFMAPEQLLGARVDRRADVYSLGATAYALRYGGAPFYQAAEVLRGAPVYFPPARSPEEAYFQHVVARMLAFKADHRYPHMMLPRQLFQSMARATAPRDTPTRVGDAEFRVGGARVSFAVGDVAAFEGDAVVNSANTEMAMRTGVGEALRRRGGDDIEVEARRGGERALGQCVLTGAGTLPLRGIVHAVAAWNEVSCIARATQRALLLAEEQGYRRIALPALGTGQGRVGLEACADAMVGALQLHLDMGGSRLEEVRVVLVDASAHARVLEVAASLLLGTDDALARAEALETPAPGADDSYADTLFGAAPTPNGRRD